MREEMKATKDRWSRMMDENKLSGGGRVYALDVVGNV